VKGKNQKKMRSEDLNSD